jgi:hypothetical protein
MSRYIPVNPESLYCDMADEGARVGLFALMSGISEEFYAASWLVALEHSLWKMVEGGPRGFGRGEVTERQVRLLKLLSEECDGWWVFDDDLTFLTLEEWRARLAALPDQTEGKS